MLRCTFEWRSGTSHLIRWYDLPDDVDVAQLHKIPQHKMMRDLQLTSWSTKIPCHDAEEEHSATTEMS